MSIRPGMTYGVRGFERRRLFDRRWWAVVLAWTFPFLAAVVLGLVLAW